MCEGEPLGTEMGGSIWATTGAIVVAGLGGSRSVNVPSLAAWVLELTRLTFRQER